VIESISAQVEHVRDLIENVRDLVVSQVVAFFCQGLPRGRCESGPGSYKKSWIMMSYSPAREPVDSGMTSSATLPKTNPFRPTRPWVVITIRSDSGAAFITASAPGLQGSDWHSLTERKLNSLLMN
jgi:hypothetical protein